jgi:hypothetical protein
LKTISIIFGQECNMSGKTLNKVVMLSILYPFLLLKPNLNSISKICWFEVISVLQEVSLRKHLRKVTEIECVCVLH